MAVIDNGGDVAGKANVSNNNLHVRTPLVEAQAGFAAAMSEIDAGSQTGLRRTKALEASSDYRLRVGLDTPLYYEVFPGSTLNAAQWNSNVSTMTTTVANGFLNLNPTAATTSNAQARIQSYKYLPTYGQFPLVVEIVAQLVVVPQVNNVTEIGIGLATGTSAPTDGAFFRLNAAGEFRAILNTAGTEIQSDTIDFEATVGAATTRKFLIVVGADDVQYWINDILVALITRSNAGGPVTGTPCLPILLRVYNSGIPPVAQQLKVALVAASIGDANISKPWSHVMAGDGQMAYQNFTGGPAGQTADYANSANPTAGAGSNSSARSSGLGGQLRLNAAAAAATDFILTGYQTPTGSNILPGRTLFITGVKISAVNGGAAVATTATTIGLSLAFGSTALALTTADGATTKAPRRIPLGIMNWPIAAAIGESAQRGDIYMPFNSPIAVNSGEFICTVAKFINGTATASQFIEFHVTFDGYWE